MCNLYIYAVGNQEHSDAETALEVAGLIAENNGCRARAVDLVTGKPAVFGGAIRPPSEKRSAYRDGRLLATETSNFSCKSVKSPKVG